MAKFKFIAKIESDVLLTLAMIMLIPLAMALIWHEKAAVTGFAAAILICALFCTVIYFTCGNASYKLKGRDSFLIVTLVWISAALISAVPYCVSGEIPDFAYAFFESASGYTTTGASILSADAYDTMAKSIMFFRSITEWLGGMGILVLLSAILPSWGISGQTLAYTESPGPSKSKFTAKFSDTAKTLYKMYLIFTATEVILLRLCGMNWYDSFFQAFSTVSTGGFSNYADSISHFNSIAVRIIIIVFMLLSAINFNLLYISARNGLRHLVKDEEVRFYLAVVGIVSVLIALCNLSYINGSIGNVFLDSVFQTSSIITTTGFSTIDFDLWPTFSKMLLFMLFFIGGCASSTSGGVKSIRVLICMRLVRRSFRLLTHPNRITYVKYNNTNLSNDIAIRAVTFVITYLIAGFIGALLLSFNGLDLVTNFSAAFSSLGNVGPGFGLVGPSMSYKCFNDFSIIVCALLMLVGRLEVLSVFMLFSRNYRNPNQVS